MCLLFRLPHEARMIRMIILVPGVKAFPGQISVATICDAAPFHCSAMRGESRGERPMQHQCPEACVGIVGAAGISRIASTDAVLAVRLQSRPSSIGRPCHTGGGCGRAATGDGNHSQSECVSSPGWRWAPHPRQTPHTRQSAKSPVRYRPTNFRK